MDTGASGEPAGIRTQDPMIKSHVLYQLSYGLYDFVRRNKRGFGSPRGHALAAAPFGATRHGGCRRPGREVGTIGAACGPVNSRTAVFRTKAGRRRLPMATR